MKKSLKIALGALAVGLMVSGTAVSASAATSSYNAQVCAPAVRPAIYGASVGTLTLAIYAPSVTRTDRWNNATRTTRVKLTNVGENFANGGLATYTGSLTDKGQDCRLF